MIVASNAAGIHEAQVEAAKVDVHVQKEHGERERAPQRRDEIEPSAHDHEPARDDDDHREDSIPSGRART